MIAGRKVARSGWNGKGMWIAINVGVSDMPTDLLLNKHSRDYAEDNGGTVKVDSYIFMKTASGSICNGWLASQADLLSFDWGLVD